MKPLIPIALILALSACATPVGPKTWTGAPPVSGTFHVAGNPVPNVEIRIISGLDRNGNPEPDARIQETRSDAEGRFTIGPLGKKAHAAYIGLFGLGESIADWALQFRHDDEWLTGWQSAGSIGYAPRQPIIADCDTTKMPYEGQIDGAGHGTRGSGFCLLALSTQK